MNTKSGRFFLWFIFVAFLSGLSIHLFFLRQESPQDLVKKQLLVSALVPQSFWNQAYFDENNLVKSKIIQFEKGDLCKNLKTLDTKHLTHKQLFFQLKDMGYVCTVRPLAVNPKASPLTYLKINRTTTANPEEEGVAHQEICFERTHPDCVIRIKRDGFPLNRRSNPHSTKAVMLDAQGDMGGYDNEAFKIGANGQAIPKGPNPKFGLRQCPYKKEKDLCDQWVDAIMEEAHPALKDPVRTGQLP